MPPSRYAIDYEAALSAAREQSTVNIAIALQQRLPSIWRDIYLGTITHEPNLVRFRIGTWESEAVADSGRFVWWTTLT